jgi:drug/metabolite transporter (DMT)-like permease
MNWVFLAIAAQFFNAVVALIDKRIVSDEQMLPRPFVYAFYTSLISGVWIVVYLFGFLPGSSQFHVPSLASVNRPTLEVVALSLLAAYTFFIALISMFSALRTADASDVVPVIGATSAIGSFLMGHFFLGTVMGSNFGFGIALLAIGSALVSHFHFGVKTALISIHAGLFFALHYIAIKGLFLITPFDNGFFWSRIAFVFFALSLLMVPNYFEKIKEHTKSATKKAGALIFGNKVLAGISTLLILKATSLGDVAVVQALGALQFVFVLLIGIFFSVQKSSLKVERYRSGIILQKALFVAIIALGFLVLFR